MRHIRALLVNLALMAASVAATLLVLEIMLRFLPVARAPAFVPTTLENPISRYEANTPFTWSLGWNFYNVVHGRTNAQGFVADYDYDAGASSPLVAVVGDSFIEAMQVPFAASVTGLLQREMGGARGRAYAIAQAGAPLSQYVAYAGLACTRYHPKKMVVNVVGNDFDQSVFAHRPRDGLFYLHPRPDGTFDWKLTPSAPLSLAERIARNSALALYLARNVGVNTTFGWFAPSAAHAQGRPWVGNTSASADAARVQEGFGVIDWFLRTLPEKACLAPADIVIVVDAPRPEIYDDAALAAAKGSYFDLMRTRLLSEAGKRGFRTVDLVPVFRAQYARTHQRFEFPTDGHWNEAGHAATAAAVRSVLGDWPPLATH